jgi:nitrogen fixation/metabolism regulation signal transduction histidine kinase
MKARFTLTAVLVLSACLLLGAPAFAGDNGEGLVGETDDKIITYFSLGLVIFFTAVALLGSWLQSLLERRKQERKASDLRQRIGW